MSLEAWANDPALGKEPCTTERQSWQCPQMKPVDGDLDMSYEHYECKLCGRRIALDHEEMK